MTPKQSKDQSEEQKNAILEALMDGIPYARFLNVSVDRRGDEITTTLHFDQKLIGNTVLPALHGGVTGALLELTASVQLAWLTPDHALPKTIDISIDYLRSGKPMDTFARAVIFKPGRRVANVRVEAWQLERDRPIAALRGHFLLAEQ